MHDTPPLALGATFGDGPRLAGGARSAGLADLVGGEGVLDVGKDALLGGAGQLADALKDVAGLADRAGYALGGLTAANQGVDGDAKLVRQGEQLFRLEGDG